MITHTHTHTKRYVRRIRPLHYDGKFRIVVVLVNLHNGCFGVRIVWIFDFSKSQSHLHNKPTHFIHSHSYSHFYSHSHSHSHPHSHSHSHPHSHSPHSHTYSHSHSHSHSHSYFISPWGIKILEGESIEICGTWQRNVPLSVLKHAIKGYFEEGYCHSLRLKGSEERWGEGRGGEGGVWWVGGWWGGNLMSWGDGEG